MKSGNQIAIVLPDRYTKSILAILVTTATSTNAATGFADNWVITYRSSTYVLTGKDRVTVCLGLKEFTTTAYHPQTNDQLERFNRTIVTGLRNYVAEHQTD